MVGAIDWRRRLARGVAWILALKLVALVLFKTLLFSGADRAAVDALAMQRHFGLDTPSNGAPEREAPTR